MNESDDKTQAATLLRELLQAAPNLLNEADIYKATPLHTAAIYRNVPAMKLLLSYKPQLDLTDSRSQTPLLIAYINSDFNMAILLISAGANVRPLRRVMKNRLLLEAVKLKNVEAIQALLDAGADVLAQDEYGRSATVLVRAIGDDEEVKGEILRILSATASVAVTHSSTLKMKQRQDTIHIKVKESVEGSIITEEEEQEEEIQIKGEGGITISTREILGGEIPREEKVKMMFKGLDAKDIPIRQAFPMPGSEREREWDEEMELQKRFEDLLVSR